MARTLHFDRYLSIKVDGEHIDLDFDDEKWGEDYKSALTRYTEWLGEEGMLTDSTILDYRSFTELVEDFFGSVDGA